jgi:molybdate transport system ATP-binding protein
VLLLDEPFSAVDRSTRKRLYVELRRLHEQLQNTIVLVTHDLDEAAQLASHLCLVRHGRLLQSGPTSGSADAPVLRTVGAPARHSQRILRPAEGRSEDHWLMRWGPHVLRVTGLPEQPARRRCAGQYCRRTCCSRGLTSHGPAIWKTRFRHACCEVIELGGEAVVLVAPESVGDTPLQLRLPARAVYRYRVEPGHSITLCLRSGDIVPLGTP